MHIELLAPAKDFEHGKAAINHGADAVYIGAPQFSARKNAGNPIAEIESLCNYAHLYKSKVYIALNTLLKNDELDNAEKIIHHVYDAGADAIIIQDMGILEMNLPPIEIHASTQTHNISPQKVLFFEKCGIKRVILARELNINEINAIRQETTVELESFVHGAICVSYSGQCYMSHAVTGRSGNRGECAQLCRTAFSLCDNAGNYLLKNKHLLSLKDLNLSNTMEAMIDAGIGSFKIEGRLKDLAYVKNITTHYRRQLDSLLEKKNVQKASSGKCSFGFTPDTEATFSRHYTPYFIDGKRTKMASFDTPKAIGKKIGCVIKITANYFEIDGNLAIANNDGLCFFNQKKELCGIKVNTVSDRKIFPQSIPSQLVVGTMLYRNNDIAFNKQLDSSINPRKIALSFHLIETENGIKLTAIDEDGITASIEECIIKEPAQNSQAALQSIVTQLKKTGNSIFEVVNCTVEFESPLFIRNSVINDIRRKTIELLDLNRSEQYKRNESPFIVTDIQYPSTIIDFTANIINSKAEQFYKRHGVQTFENGFELQNDFTGKTIMTTKYCLRFELGMCLIDKSHKQTLGLELPLFLENNARKFRLYFDCKKCEMKIIY
jgi:putative protease